MVKVITLCGMPEIICGSEENSFILVLKALTHI